MSLRQVVLDTETTGLNPRTGDRIIEVGCVELVDRRLTGNTFHHYVNPGRDSAEGALRVHGLTTEFLSDKPAFEAIADALCDFVAGAEVLIHNASFDVAFLDEELSRLERPHFAHHCENVIDTLLMARELHPGKRNSLDALRERYGVSNAHRTLHGALLDAELLAEVYLAMTRGQESLVIDIAPRQVAHTGRIAFDRTRLPIIVATDDELLAHRASLASIAKESRKPAVWATIAALESRPALQ